MNKTFEELLDYVKNNINNVVAFPDLLDNNFDNSTYPKEINCMYREGQNKIIVISRNGKYTITENNIIKKNKEFNNLFHIYSNEGNEVLTIEINV